jgi:hypothetical protein
VDDALHKANIGDTITTFVEVEVKMDAAGSSAIINRTITFLISFIESKRPTNAFPKEPVPPVTRTDFPANTSSIELIKLV